MSWFSDIFSAKTEDWFYGQIPAGQTPDNAESKPVTREEEYLHIFLKSMRIVNIRKGLSKFYPTVHSHIEVGNISGTSANFNVVTTPGNLEKLDGENIDKVINVNRRLLGPVPYRGGGIKMEIGLFSVKEADLAEPYIKLLTSMSTLGGVSFLATALPYVKPLEQGIELLTGSAASTILEIGLTREFDTVNTGYFVVMRAEKDKVKVSDLRISAEDFRLTDQSGQTIKDYPYLVFEITSSPFREDFFNIPDVSSVFNKLQQELRDGDTANAKVALSVLKRTLYTSSDLLLKDAKVIYQKIEADTNEILRTALETRQGLKRLENYSPF